jgi:hypothetical protein
MKTRENTARCGTAVLQMTMEAGDGRCPPTCLCTSAASISDSQSFERLLRAAVECILCTRKTPQQCAEYETTSWPFEHDVHMHHHRMKGLELMKARKVKYIQVSVAQKSLLRRRPAYLRARKPQLSRLSRAWVGQATARTLAVCIRAKAICEISTR